MLVTAAQENHKIARAHVMPTTTECACVQMNQYNKWTAVTAVYMAADNSLCVFVGQC